MKYSLLVVIFILCFSCEERLLDHYTEYLLPKGSHGGFGKPQFLSSYMLQFKAIFDETAIYTSKTEENQHDVNKLLGFSDCNVQHHQNSARFGWRWLNGQLEILAYCYVSGNRVVEPVGTIDLNKPSQYTITLKDDHYVFQLDNYPEVRIDRVAHCNKGIYYMLCPYFGGDEKAPHDITIKVQIQY